MAGLPKVLVELDDGSGTFPYDISQYVDLTEGVSVTRGRRDQASQIEASELNLTLDNRDGRFTIGSTVYGVRLDQKIRCSWVVGGTTSRRFTGYVEKWPVSWDGGPGRQAHVAITALDDLPRWERRTVTERLRAYLNRNLGPSATYWPLAEPAGSTLARADLGGYTMRVVSGTPAFGVSGVPVSSPSTAVALNGARLAVGQPYRTVRLSLRIGCYVQTSVVSQTLLTERDSSDSFVTVALDDAGKLTVSRTWTVVKGQPQTQQLTGGGPVVVADGSVHYIEVNLTSTSDNTLDVTMRADTLVRTGSLSGTNIAVRGSVRGTLTATGVATMAHLWRQQPSLTNFDSQAVSSLKLRAGTLLQRSDLALTDALAQPGTSLGVVGQGVQIARSPNDPTRSIADVVDAVTDAEAGLTFIAGDGRVTFQNRTYRASQKPAMTFAADAALPDDDFLVQYDMEGVVNYWSGQREVGDGEQAATLVSQDSASIARHDQRPASSTTLAVATDQDVQDRGDWLVATSSEPRPRLPDLALDLLTMPLAFQQQAAALELSSRLTLTGLPAQAPPIGDLVVEGWSETVKSGSSPAWSMGLNLSSFADYVAWTLEDAEFGALDGPGRLIF